MNAVIDKVDAVQQIADADRRKITLAHWGTKEDNKAWIDSCASDDEFLAQMNAAVKAKGKKAQGKGLYLLERPDQYSPKKGSDSLMIVECTAVPFLDVTGEPRKGEALFDRAGLRSKDAVYQLEDSKGFPPRMLMKYGGYYRLSTATGVSMSTEMSTIDPKILEAWRKRLWSLSDKSGFNAFKAQAKACGVDTSTW